MFDIMQQDAPITISILNHLEEDIQNVVNASIPNKQQNRAAAILVSDHFRRARYLYEEAIQK